MMAAFAFRHGYCFAYDMLLFLSTGKLFLFLYRQFLGDRKVSQIAYNEFKFLVTNEKLNYVKSLLRGFYGESDLFPEGVVDSIYYDSQSRECYRQCLDGEPQKSKFRIRGYGDNKFSQVHLKSKDVFGVSKLKNPIFWQQERGLFAPSWESLRQAAGEKAGASFHSIMAAADQFGPMQPAIRVRYYRYRYRIHDYRMTLDTRIEVQGFSNGWDQRLNYGVIPYHVLELKTLDSRPVLPFMNLTQLPQVSFSKFFLGLQLLELGAV